MANTISKTGVSIVDAKGYFSQVRVFVSWDTEAHAHTLISAWVTAMAALTNGNPNGGPGIPFQPQTPGLLGTQADFGSVEDKALLTYVDTAGSIHRYQIPCPKVAIFYADGMTVDPTNASIVAFNQIMLNAAANAYFISSRTGQQLNDFVGGVRIRRRNRRRLNIFIRNPAETGPAE